MSSRPAWNLPGTLSARPGLGVCVAYVLAERPRDEGEHALPNAQAGQVVEGHRAHRERDTPAARHIEDGLPHLAERRAISLDVGRLCQHVSRVRSVRINLEDIDLRIVRRQEVESESTVRTKRN